jgi:hypothetical protein
LPAGKLLAFAFKENVTEVGEFVAVPELDDTESQFGTPEIE